MIMYVGVGRSRRYGSMLRISMFFLLLGALPSFAIPAQRAGTSLAPASDSADDRVLNCPYSAQRRFTSIERLADGTSRSTESGGSEARDSKGRTYSAGERHWTYVDHGKPVLKSEMLYRIHDPVSNTDTSWDSTSKEVKVIHWPKGAPRGAFGVGAFLADVPGTVTEKLGLRTIEGVVAEGTRSAYTVAGEQDEDRKPMSVVHESWYCPELRSWCSRPTTIPVGELLEMSWWASFEENQTSRNTALLRITSSTTYDRPRDSGRKTALAECAAGAALRGQLDDTQTEGDLLGALAGSTSCSPCL